MGFVPRVAFPSGALVRDGRLQVYYGAADTGFALASVDLELLLAELDPSGRLAGSNVQQRRPARALRRQPHHCPAAGVRLGGERRIQPGDRTARRSGPYRLPGPGNDDRSVLGYAVSGDGFAVDERPNEPIYLPREPIELPAEPGCGSGCEDPRLTMIGEELYLLYTAYNGHDARVALSSIAVDDFRARRWNWSGLSQCRRRRSGTRTPACSRAKSTASTLFSIA